MPWSLNENDICEVTYRGKAHGQTILNVFHYKAVDMPAPVQGEPALSELLDALVLANKWKDLLLLASSSSYTLEAIRAQVVYPIRRPLVEDPVNEQGLRQAAPNTNLAAVITWRNDEVAKKGRVGATHIGPVASNDQTNGLISGGAGSLHEALLNFGSQGLEAISVLLGGATFDPVIWSRRIPQTPLPIASHTTQLALRVMRRRTVGLGI